MIWTLWRANVVDRDLESERGVEHFAEPTMIQNFGEDCLTHFVLWFETQIWFE